MASRNNQFDVQTDILQRDQVLFCLPKEKGLAHVSDVSDKKFEVEKKKKIVKKRKQQQKLPA